MKTIEEVLFEGSSPQGRAKAMELSTLDQPWLFPSVGEVHRLEGTGIGHRISWEWLQDDIKNGSQRIMKEMRSAQVGAHNAVYMDRKAISATEAGVFVIQSLLPRTVSDYDPGNGFDLDVFIFVRDLAENDATVSIEIFPRAENGVHSRAIASGLRTRTPYVVLDGENDKRTLRELVFMDQLLDGGSPDMLQELWRSWTGPWPVTGQSMIAVFVTKCFMSYLVAMGLKTTWTAPSVTRSASGEVMKADLERGLSVRR